MVAGPVIIEEGRVLLNREKTQDGREKELFMFPGGGVVPKETLHDACKREAQEELGIEIVIIAPLKIIHSRHSYKACDVMLYHFLCKRIGEIHPGKETIEWGWFDIHNLPNNCAPNVYEIIQDIKKEL